MLHDRRRQIEEICDGALNQPISERAAFVAVACGQDRALREEVEALLAHAPTAEALLSGHIGAVAAHLFDASFSTSIVGRQIGSYRILSWVGAGGMGEVYRARDTTLNRDVAIKILPPAFTSDRERLARFKREARLLAALNHPHIAAIFGVEELDGCPALVLELVDGATLAERLNAGPLPVPEAVMIARQIADALAAAHDKGIIHRDLKPANVKFTSDGVLKVLDFGVAKVGAGDGAVRDVAQSPHVTVDGTRDGVILGTAGYMSPEQARGQAVDTRTDIFAFGAILYEMLSGQRAFRGDTAMDAIAAVLNEDPPHLAAAHRDIPPVLTRIVDRCLQKKPTSRFQSASDLAFALEGLSSPSDSPATGTIARGRTGLLQNARLAWGTAAGFALVVAVLTIGTTRYVRSSAPKPVVTRLDIVTPPTSEPFSFALSLDGRQLAFVANGEKGSQLWVRPLDQVMAKPLAGTEGATFPFWAPDGDALGFFADGKLKRIDLTGGAPQILADVSTPRGGTWSRNGLILFSPSSNEPLMGIRARGGVAAPVIPSTGGMEDGNFQYWPQFLPDGRRFLFMKTAGQPKTWGIYLASVDGGEPTWLMQANTQAAYAPPGYLLYVSQNVLMARAFDTGRGTLADETLSVAQGVGTELDQAGGGIWPGAASAFSVSANGVLAHRASIVSRRQLAWIDRSGKLLGSVGSPDVNSLTFPDLAPDGRRVATTRIIPANPDVWLIDAGENVWNRFTFDAGIDSAPLWSPDGSQIVFRTLRRGAYDLFVKPVSGTVDEQPLLVTPLAKSPLDWSRDGRFLLYSTQDPNTGTDLWALPMTGERKPFAVLQSQYDEIEGQFSPDGHWLAYASNESGRDEVYVRPFPEAGRTWQVSVAGGSQPRWARDGHELFYVAPDSRLMAVPIRVPSAAHALEPGAPVALFPTKLATGAFIVTSGFQARAQYAVSADGRFLMNVSADDAVTLPITIVQNWTVGLKH